MSPEISIASIVFAGLVSFAVAAVNVTLLLSYFHKNITTIRVLEISILVATLIFSFASGLLLLSAALSIAFGL